MKYPQKVSAFNKLMNVIRKITPKTFIAYEKNIELNCNDFHAEPWCKSVTQKFHLIIKNIRYEITIKEVS